MAGQGAPTAIAPSGVRGCRCLRQGQTQQSSAPAETDRLAPLQSAKWPAARLAPRPDAEIVGGEVSSRLVDFRLFYSITSSARARTDGGISSPSALAAL